MKQFGVKMEVVNGPHFKSYVHDSRQGKVLMMILKNILEPL